MNKVFIGAVFAAVLATATIVAASYAWDSDGGWNIWEKGTCYEDNQTVGTDTCYGGIENSLREWYLDSYINNQTNETVYYCVFETVRCLDYNASCINGECRGWVEIE